MKRLTLVSALLSCVAGLVALSLAFPRYWPADHWKLEPREQLIQQGRQVASHFGVKLDGWNAYVITRVSKTLVHYAPSVSPVSVRITYLNPKGGDATEIGFGSGGDLNYWRAPKEHKGQAFGNDAAAAQAAFQFVASGQAVNYQNPRKSSGDDDGEEVFEFKKTPIPGSDVRERIKVTTKASAVERVERKVYLSSYDEDDSGGEAFWPVLGAVSGFIYSCGIVAMVAIFILWTTRKALDRQFHTRMAIVTFVLEMCSLLAGSEWDKFHSVNSSHSTPGVTQFFGALSVVVFVAVGRGISLSTRPKWISLEQICRLAPIAKPTGEAIAAGLLFSPLLAAFPFIIAAVFPQSWLMPPNIDLFYSRGPLLDSLPLTVCGSLLFFFGFLLPVAERFVGSRWLRSPLVLPVGVVFFAPLIAIVWGPMTAALIAAGFSFALYWFVWAQFDLLAILTLQTASGLLLGLFALWQKGHSPWSFVATLIFMAGAAAWCWLKGSPVVAGDPLATNPTVTGFRAEREKLVAEFSVARRAQQDMLPQAPPHIPGYSIAASCTPSLEVGGDLYDFLRLNDGRIGLGVADVSGKGVPAALYMTLTKGLLAAVTRNSSELKPVIEEVNRHLHGVTRKKVFVTMALGFLDVEKRLLECVRAGHNPMVWRQQQKNETRLVSPGGLGLGITASRVFTTQLKVEELQLAEGDAVVFYSDGITEAMNRSLEQFGEQRLMDAVDRTDALDASTARDSILTEVRAFLDGVHPQDDMTLVFLRVGEHH